MEKLWKLQGKMGKSENNRLRARVVLDDCRAAFAELKATTDQDEFRRRWFALSASLRSVGDTANRTDSKASKLHKQAIEKHWDGGAEIFESFIRATRNQTVHEYRSGLVAAEGDSGATGSFTTSAMSDIPRTVMADRHTRIRMSVPKAFVFADGPYKGRDVYGVIDEALEFWDNHLGNVEREINEG